MAAFSAFQHSNPFLLDAGLLLDDPNNALFSQICQYQTFQNLDQSTKVSGASNNEVSVLSVTNKNSMDSSSIITDYKHHHHHHNNTNNSNAQTHTPLPKKRKSKEVSANSAQSKDMREMKSKKQKKLKDGETKKKDEKKTGDDPIGYIHVRARRGQATDSHSLAERVRRERISERMKLLQTLVPGCEKVTGKALMLDEIINYVQSLQNQVEFLSMKLASVNPMFYDFGMDLESFMIRPDQNLSSLQPSPLPNMQQCSPTTVNYYPILDDSSINSHLFQQPQLIPNAFPQGNRQVLWEMNEQRQKIINQSGFSTNSLFSHFQ